MRLVQLLLLVGLLLTVAGTPVQAQENTAILLSGVAAGDAKAPVLLLGRAEVNDQPDVDMFQELVMREPGLSCQTRSSMNRLFRVARDEQMRQLVWKRMQHQELLWVPHKVLAQIERCAALCNMRLVP